jgi:hypothetical protein
MSDALQTKHDAEIAKAARLIAAGFREVGWRWWNAAAADRVPSADEVERQIRRLVGDARDHTSRRADLGCGGIRVVRDGDDISILLGVGSLFADRGPATGAESDRPHGHIHEPKEGR